MSGRFALIIAVDEYADESLRRLTCPIEDARGLAEVLGDAEIGQFDTQLLINQPSHAVTRAVEAFCADRERDDLLLLYFSGHGVKDAQGRLFFAMPDTERRLLNATGVSAAFVNEALAGTRARTNVLLLDCCYSGAFARGASTKGDTSVQTAERFSASGRVVLTASDSLQYSFEGQEIDGRPPQSVFTRHLITGLQSGDADLDRDGEIALGELYDYVYDKVVSEGVGQRPGKWEWDVRGKLTIAKNPRAVTLLPSPVADAIASPLAGVREGVVSELAQLLVSPSAPLARAAELGLRALVGDDSRRVSEAAARALRPAPEPSTPSPARPTPPAPPAPPAPPVLRTDPVVITPTSAPRTVRWPVIAAIEIGVVLAGVLAFVPWDYREYYSDTPFSAVFSSNAGDFNVAGCLALLATVLVAATSGAALLRWAQPGAALRWLHIGARSALAVPLLLVARQATLWASSTPHVGSAIGVVLALVLVGLTRFGRQRAQAAMGEMGT